MKNIAIIALTFLSSIVAFAAEIGPITSSANRVITMDYAGFENGTTTLTISNAAGEQVYAQQKSSPSKLSKRFFIKESIGNEFVVKVENELRAITAAYKIENGAAILVSSDAFVKPVFKLNENIATINYLNTEEEKVSVYLFDESGDILFENHLIDQNINQAFDLRKFTGNYLIVSVVKGTQKFSHVVQL